MINPFAYLLCQRVYKQGDLLSMIRLAARIHEFVPYYAGPESMGPIVRYCYRYLRDHACAESAERFLAFHKDSIFED